MTTASQCRHCDLLFVGGDEDEQARAFYEHHQRVHRDCPDWEDLESYRYAALDDGSGRVLRVGDPPRTPTDVLRN